MFTPLGEVGGQTQIQLLLLPGSQVPQVNIGAQLEHYAAAVQIGLRTSKSRY